MPQVTVYVREEDIEKWRAIEHKSQFLHDAIHGTVIGKDFETKQDVRDFVSPPKIRPLAEVIEDDPLADLEWVEKEGTWDKRNLEWVESDAETTKELRRRGQVR